MWAVLHSAFDMSPHKPGNSRTGRNESSLGGSHTHSGHTHSHVRFGLYEVNLRTRELRKGGFRLKVPNQSFQILAMLLEKPGQVVAREDLRRELWPGEVFVNFEGSLNSAVRELRSALQDTSRHPRYIETLPRAGYRFIASVENPIPASEEAPQRAAALDSAEFLSVGETSDESTTVVSVPGRDWRYWTAGGLLLVLLAAYAGYQHRRRNSSVPAAEVQTSRVTLSTLNRHSVAVMGFTNVSGHAGNSWLSTAFTEMLATELAAGDQLRTVAAEDVARAKLELSLSNEDSYAAKTLTKIHNDLGCDYVVTGSYLAVVQAGKRRLRLDTRLQDAVTGDTVAIVAVVGSQSDLFELASRAGEQLRAKLGVAKLTVTEAEEVRVALPSDPEAARLYADGLAKLRFYDDVAAGDLFRQVIGLQPEYGPAYSALASAWFALGFDAKAAVAIRKATDLSRNLPLQTRLQTEARYHKISGDWAQAAEIYSLLQRSYPDNLDYGLDLAFAQNMMGNSAEALAMITALRKLPYPERDDPRIDLTEARIADDLADYKREQALAETAARKSEIAGERLLLARAELVVGYASDDLGNLSSSSDAYAVAQRMFAESGDVDGAALALMNIGITLVKQGDLAGAKRRIEGARNVFRKKGDQESLAASLTDLSEIYAIEGNLPEQEHLLRESLVISNKLNRADKRDIETCNLSLSLQRQGKFREAEELLEPLAEHLRGAGKKSLLGYAIEILGSIAEVQGEIPTALRMDQEAAALFKYTGSKTEYAGAERSLGEVFFREADFVSAKQAVLEALSIHRDLGAKADTALDQVVLAEIASAQGRPVDMGTLRFAFDELRILKMTDDEIEAGLVIARGIIQQGNTAEAASMLRQTSLLSAKSYDPTVRFDVALATARLRVAQHRFGEARRAVRPALQNAATMGCVRCQLEARLELGEIEIRAGNAERGRAQLRELADDAGGKGFLLIAEHAATDSR